MLGMLGLGEGMDISQIVGKLDKIKQMMPVAKGFLESYKTAEENAAGSDVVALAQLSEQNGEIVPTVTLAIVSKVDNKIVISRIVKNEKKEPMRWNLFELLKSVGNEQKED